MQVRTHCGHISDMFPPPVVFPATREVMEGYKTVSILHISRGCTHALSTQPAHEDPLHLDQNLFNIQLSPSSHEPPCSYRPHITTILHFVFDTQSIPISPLTNISAARPSCSPVLQGPAAGPLQSPVSVNTRLWPLIGHQPSSGQKYI